MVDPANIIKLLELYETRAGRVGLFVRGFFTFTNEPSDQLPLERLFEKWRSWKMRFKMSEAEFRSHLRANRFDVYEGDGEPCLVGWASATPRPMPRNTRQLNAAVLLRYAHMSGSIEALADNCGIPIRRLRSALRQDRQLREVIDKAIEAGKQKRQDAAVCHTPAEVIDQQMKWNFRSRSPEQLLATAQKEGFASYVDYADAVRKKKVYKRALASGDPATDEFHRQWRDAEGKKLKRGQSNRMS